MDLYRLVCALGHQSIVMVLTRCGLPLPAYVLADEQHSRCLTDKVYLPTIVTGWVIWHLGYTENASAAALTQSYGEFQRAASQQEPSYRVRGILTDGFDSTTKSLHTLFPGARLGNCLRHAINKLPKQLAAIASPVRQALRSQFHTLLYRARQRKGLRVFALGQPLLIRIDSRSNVFFGWLLERGRGRSAPITSGSRGEGCPYANMATTSFTLVGNSADSPEPVLRPSPATGHDTEMLEV